MAGVVSRTDVKVVRLCMLQYFSANEAEENVGAQAHVLPRCDITSTWRRAERRFVVSDARLIVLEPPPTPRERFVGRRRIDLRAQLQPIQHQPCRWWLEVNDVGRGRTLPDEQVGAVTTQVSNQTREFMW